MSTSRPILCAPSGSDPQWGPSSALRRARLRDATVQARTGGRLIILPRHVSDSEAAGACGIAVGGGRPPLRRTISHTAST